MYGFNKICCSGRPIQDIKVGYSKRQVDLILSLCLLSLLIQKLKMVMKFLT